MSNARDTAGRASDGTVTTPEVRETLIAFALWISAVWDAESGDDVDAAERAVDAFLRGEERD